MSLIKEKIKTHSLLEGIDDRLVRISKNTEIFNLRNGFVVNYYSNYVLGGAIQYPDHRVDWTSPTDQCVLVNIKCSGKIANGGVVVIPKTEFHMDVLSGDNILFNSLKNNTFYNGALSINNQFSVYSSDIIDVDLNIRIQPVSQYYFIWRALGTGVLNEDVTYYTTAEFQFI